MTDSQQQRFAELVGVAACFVLKNLAWYYVSTRRAKSRVGQVQQILIYPVKSCRGFALPEAEIRDGGICWREVRDRSYLVLSSADNKFVSLKVFPTLHQVQPALDPDRLGRILLTADGHESVPVPDPVRLNRPVTFDFKGEKHSGLDCGDEVAAWLNSVCNRQDLRLVYCPSNQRSVADKMRALDKQGGMLQVYDSLHETSANRIAFADKAPILMVSDKSFEALNNRLTGKHPGVDWRNFRPNLVISGVQQDREEDNWGFVYFAGGCILAAAFPCERCIMVNLDYSAGDRAVAPSGNPVLTALAPYRSGPKFKNPLFGVDCTVEMPGRVAIGEATSDC
uniref:MOSC domain-containing protein n=1 Tax=Macrostomum lignano TaxID=282301 RepID=A0A1I8HFU5_9PLAT